MSVPTRPLDRTSTNVQLREVWATQLMQLIENAPPVETALFRRAFESSDLHGIKFVTFPQALTCVGETDTLSMGGSECAALGSGVGIGGLGVGGYYWARGDVELADDPQTWIVQTHFTPPTESHFLY